MDPTEDASPAESPPVEYTDAARARIALSAAAAELADRLLGIVDTQHEIGITPILGLIERVNSLGGAVDELRRLAVIHGRECSLSWEDVGQALGVTRQTAHARFADVVDEWRDALYDPAKHRYEWMPDGSYNPEKVVPYLDAWLARHQHHPESPRSVSAGLHYYGSAPIARVREAISRTQWLSARLAAGDDVSAEAKADNQRRTALTSAEVAAHQQSRRAES